MLLLELAFSLLLKTLDLGLVSCEVEGLNLGLISVLVSLLELEYLGSQLLILLLHVLHLLYSDLV